VGDGAEDHVPGFDLLDLLDHQIEFGLEVNGVPHGELLVRLRVVVSVPAPDLQDAQGSPFVGVLDDLLEEVVRGLEYFGLHHLGRGHQGVPEVPPVDGEVVVDTIYPRDRGASPPLPVIFDIVHELARPEQRERALPEARLVAQSLLQAADQELQVERQSSITEVVGIPKMPLPAQLAGD
jgi:hypothetical protein